MADKRDIIRSQNTGFFQDLIMHLKLLMKLMGDRRVNFFLKLLPVATLVYLIAPIDLAPGLVLPLIGALDDAAVIWLGTSLFVSLCPTEVVREHLTALEKVVEVGWREAQDDEQDEIVDAQARDEAPAALPSEEDLHLTAS